MPDTHHHIVNDSLADMIAIIRQHGGFVHPALTFEVSTDGIAAMLSEPVGDELLVKLPLALLIPAELLSWRLHDGEFLVQDDQHVLSPVQARLLKLLVAIYNAQNQPTWAAQHVLRAHAPVDEGVVVALNAIMPNCQLDRQPLVDTFLQTRYLLISGEKSDGIVAGDHQGDELRVLMPLIDFFNHHPAGASFAVSKNGLGIKAISASEHTTQPQVFACYGGFRDVLMMALKYGYLDNEIPYVYSAPFVWHDPKLGKVRVQRKQVPAQNKFHFPKIDDDDELSFSHVLINAEQPSYLTGTVQVAFLKRGTRLGFSRAQCLVAEQRFLHALLQFNIELHGNLQQALQAVESTPALVIIEKASKRCVTLINDVYKSALSEPLDGE
ncbi:MAG: hypothetical protein JJU03_04530 [Idiomarina sp.]|nr:hypothetical protein [Idiomarina sp.]